MMGITKYIEMDTSLYSANEARKKKENPIWFYIAHLIGLGKKGVRFAARTHQTKYFMCMATTLYITFCVLSTLFSAPLSARGILFGVRTACLFPPAEISVSLFASTTFKTLVDGGLAQKEDGWGGQWL